MKKGYHKVSLRVHPDRVSPKEKEEATKKFQALGRVYSILSDENKRGVYDETGIKISKIIWSFVLKIKSCCYDIMNCAIILIFHPTPHVFLGEEFSEKTLTPAFMH